MRRTVRVMDRKWWTLIAVSVATFMLLLDITIVNVALPEIERDLGSSFSDLQWVIDAYALTLAALLLTGGSLADLYGRRRIFVIGIAIFTARVGAVRARRHAAGPQPRAGAPGRRRGVHVRDLAGAARLRLPGPRPRHGVRRLGRGDRRVGRGRPAGRRRAHRRHRLGGDLPRQHPDRHRGDRDDAREGRGVARPERRAARLARAALVLGRAVRAHLRADPRQRRGLGLPADRRLPRRWRSCSASPSCSSSAAAPRRCSTSRCSPSPPSPAPRSPPSRCRRRCSRCSSTSRSTSRTSSATRRSSRACASCP